MAGPTEQKWPGISGRLKVEYSRLTHSSHCPESLASCTHHRWNPLASTAATGTTPGPRIRTTRGVWRLTRSRTFATARRRRRNPRRRTDTSVPTGSVSVLHVPIRHHHNGPAPIAGIPAEKCTWRAKDTHYPLPATRYPLSPYHCTATRYPCPYLRALHR